MIPMQSNRCEPHKARNLAHASCGAKGHTKILLNVNKFHSPVVPARQDWCPTNNGSPRVRQSLIPYSPMRRPISVAEIPSGQQYPSDRACVLQKASEVFVHAELLPLRMLIC